MTEDNLAFNAKLEPSTDITQNNKNLLGKCGLEGTKEISNRVFSKGLQDWHLAWGDIIFPKNFDTCSRLPRSLALIHALISLAEDNLAFNAMLEPSTNITQNNKNPLKLSILFSAKSYDGFFEDFLQIEIDFGWNSLLNTP